MTAAASNLQRISRMLRKQLNLGWLYPLSSSPGLI